MQFRNFVLVLVAIAAAILLIRRRKTAYVDIHFDDDATIRLARGPEAEDLLDDAYAALDVVE